MKLARIVRNWTGIDLLRQTPGGRGVWDDVRFTLDEVTECDYLLISNCVPHDVEVICPPEHVWAIMCEPPERFAKRWHTAMTNVYRVYAVDPEFRGERYIHRQTALPWHVDRDFDFLASCACPRKTRMLSWVTSSIDVFAGHKARLRFLERIRGSLEFDLFGRGFAPIDDKWDGLAPYRYSLAIENYRNPYYWTEKIADCFLAWTMPIYCGCTRITDYFPAEAMIQIDMDAPEVADQIREEIAADRWRRGLDAIAYARELVLRRYQFFPFMTDEIHQMESRNGVTQRPRRIAVRDTAQRDVALCGGKTK